MAEAAPLPLPSAPPLQVNEYVTLQPPLTHRGNGPAVILVIEAGLDLGRSTTHLDPPPLQKWAEEGFTVAQILIPRDYTRRWDFPEHFLKCVEALWTRPGTDGKIGLISILNRTPGDVLS
jgi:carboxymethylenebutenolidase